MTKSNDVAGFIVTGTLAPIRATQYMTYSRRDGEKVNIVPGDSIPEAIEKAEAEMYWDLQLRKIMR